jgi:hypothetical protein
MLSALVTPIYYKDEIILPCVLSILLSQPNRRMYVDLYCISVNCGAVHLMCGYSCFGRDTLSDSRGANSFQKKTPSQNIQTAEV